MINFWATLVRPVPAGNAAAREHLQEVQQDGLHAARRERRAGLEGRERWLKKTPVSFPILFDTESKVSKLYKVAGMPSTVIVDRKGNVRVDAPRLQAGRRERVPEQHPHADAGVERARRPCAIEAHRWRSRCCAGAQRGCAPDRAVGEALRARASRGSDHGLRPQPRVVGVSRPRVRVPRRRARRQRQRRRRLRVQLTMRDDSLRRRCTRWLLIAPARAAAFARRAAEDRADVLYHRYQGGGITIDGPSVLVRKKFGEKFAVSANYYVDMVSSASIDVELTASPYKEERTQKSVGVRLPARQVHLQRGRHRQQGVRLHRRHGVLLAQPGHVRRPDHRDA